MSAPPERYLIALGSNVRHARHGAPAAVLRAAVAAMQDAGLAVRAFSPVIASAPLGPSRRRYANAAALVETPLAPRALLARLHAVEQAFGRVRRGARWGARTLDLDIVLWSGGKWRDKALVIPHREYRARHFVLVPAARIAADWRDPHTGLAVKHQAARLTRRTPALSCP
ncbi:2-amino-4-hydroxy-6-hydroxymethyldihydropteridine diphosphokinase [Novosphingobium sp. KCTC 2891]|uniref:2-amino-4-hydroxy-6- hydroxymethyldihydropteridine diphosphokinase n=1 Tax=Novosphingobium sp. KCTC 2891 TaxID=2989730 RepID=UPI0022227A90|nr:2-amino-4-hydroxy-6-hydroxymethyldihydropteridine diphosphokinase [Novosphingobium sp. KCTC 2891]MCW1383135.1 2-amino-4-hydroxy-6-hydroxymethyldihydropteridine diphosphokinase [Novosphingobium sp. KCTC 2891]